MVQAIYSPGDVVAGKYVIRGVIGQGGFGIVFLAYDQQIKEICALKTFRDDLLSDAKARDAFRRELALWLNLGQHPAIVEARFVDSESGRLFVKMEYVQPDDLGRISLQDHIERSEGVIQGRKLLEWAIHVCHAMEHAKTKGVVCHRDIKPANILIAEGKRAKLSDFGLAIAAERSLSSIVGLGNLGTGNASSIRSLTLLGTEGGHFCGTIGYVAPELAHGYPASEQSDIYAFGIVIWQMATGCPVPPWLLQADPRRGDFLSQVLSFQERVAIPALPDDRLQRIVSRSVQIHQGSRYSGFAELRKDLENIHEEVLGAKPVAPVSKAENAAYWGGRAGAMDAIGDHKKAIECADKALALDIRQKAAWHNKAMAMEHMGHLEEALDCLGKALEIDPSQKESWSNRGNICRRLRRYDEAFSSYDHALAIDQSYSNAWLGKANLLVELGKHEDALLCHNRHLELDHKSAYGWNSMGATLDELGRSEEAVECFRTALRIDPMYAGAWSNLGVAMEALGKHCDALDCYTKACSFNPREPAAWYNKGCSERKLGMKKEAARSYRKFLLLNPLHLPSEKEKATAYLSKYDAHSTIHQAAARGEIGVVEAILQSNPRLLHEQDQRPIGYTPLHYATREGQEDMVRYLLNVGADVNITARNGETPLMTAIEEHHPELALYLLSKGAHPFGKTDLEQTPLHFAAIENLETIARVLLSKGAEVNAKMRDGFTPLDVAKEYGSVEVQRVLLAHGAKEDEENRRLFRKSLGQ